MLVKAGIKVSEPFAFKIVNGKIVDSDATKHLSWNTLFLPEGIRKFLVLRRLPDWLKSITWHYSKHFVINDNGNCVKQGISKSYSNKFKQVPGYLPPPNFLAYSIYPDSVLSKYYKLGENIEILRMEYLIEDVKKHLSIDLRPEPKEYSYSPPEKYWTEEALEILYRNNPLWATLERNYYSNK